MVQRLTYRRRLSYNTRSNKVRIIRTPGGNRRYLNVKKKGTVPKCGDCGHRLQGIKALRPKERASVPKRYNTVHRVYGGSRCANCVRNRVLRAFLVGESKVSRPKNCQKTRE